MRRALGLAGAACLLVLGTLPAYASRQPGDQGALAAQAEVLPAQLKDAVRRDLGIEPVAYLGNGRAAQQAAALADRLRGELGGSFGGAWFEAPSGKLRVAVTDQAAADKAKAHGALTEIRPGTADQTAKAVVAMIKWVAELPVADRALVYGITPDARSGWLRLVLADSPAGQALAARLPKVEVPLRVERTDHAPAPPAARAQGCGFGLNAIDRAGTAVSLSPAHCASLADTDKFVLTSLDNNGPGDDLASARVTDPRARPEPKVAGPGGAQRVERVGSALPGTQVCSAARGGYSCGTVFARHAVWRFGESGAMALRGFEVHGLCVNGGGALLAGGAALGWTSAAYLDGAGGRCRQVPGPNGPTQVSLAESLETDVLPAFDGVRLLSAEGDADTDGVRDVDELAADRTQVRDTNNDGVAAYLDPDEPKTRAPSLVSPANGAKETDTTPVLHGTARPGAKVVLKLDGNPQPEITADAQGNWRLELADKLCLGGHEVTLKQNVAGQDSAESVVAFTVIPPTPTITTPSGSDRSRLARPEIAGTGRPKALVTVFVDGVPVASTAVGQDGQWRLRPDRDLSPGQRTITARQTVTRVDSAEAVVRYDVGGAPVVAGERDTGTGDANSAAAELKSGGHPVGVAIGLGTGLLVLLAVWLVRRFRGRLGND
ncbi:hypothetical protein JOF53_004605 [Crossiella equi]|uniref:Bacterial Ig domain-containing protein n=1 Tax=Crossiella equi TaxID=130796 RepID=A0ABS5AGL8_9PSEU|nr:hypothetical protein [Crossiella equi]MBP2475733.1 hypothetical protein [Crossiella equi]